MIVPEARTKRRTLKHGSGDIYTQGPRTNSISYQDTNGDEPARCSMRWSTNQEDLIFGIGLAEFQVNPECQVAAGLGVAHLADVWSTHVEWTSKSPGIRIVSK
jgi:hypothetical protein